MVCVTAAMNLWTRVPSLPTHPAIVKAMIEMANMKDGETIVDVGAGDGRLLIAAKKKCPTIHARGCEIVPTVWLIGKLRILFSGASVRLRLGDAMKENVADADALFFYLFPEVMSRLSEKLDRELKPGARIISHTFKLPGKTPITEKKVRGYVGETSVYEYRWS